MATAIKERVDWTALAAIDWGSIHEPEEAGGPVSATAVNEGHEVFVSPAHFAGAVAFEALTNSTWYAEGLTALYGKGSLVPDEFRTWLFELLNDAGRIGFLVGKIEVPAFDGHLHVTEVQAARAVATLIGMDLVEPKATPA